MLKEVVIRIKSPSEAGGLVQKPGKAHEDGGGLA